MAEQNLICACGHALNLHRRDDDKCTHRASAAYFYKLCECVRFVPAKRGS